MSDVVEAMSFHRPYHPALGLENALAEISCHSDTLYDPDVASACLGVFRPGNFKFTGQREGGLTASGPRPYILHSPITAKGQTGKTTAEEGE